MAIQVKKQLVNSITSLVSMLLIHLVLDSITQQCAFILSDVHEIPPENRLRQTFIFQSYLAIKSLYAQSSSLNNKISTNIHLYFLLSSQSSGLKKIIQDIKFMNNTDLGIYWKFTWGICPLILLAIFAYSMVYLELPTVRDEPFPDIAYGKDWIWIIVFTITKLTNKKKFVASSN